MSLSVIDIGAIIFLTQLAFYPTESLITSGAIALYTSYTVSGSFLPYCLLIKAILPQYPYFPNIKMSKLERGTPFENIDR